MNVIVSNNRQMRVLTSKVLLTFSLVLFFVASGFSKDDVTINLKGFGFAKFGRVQHTSDTLDLNFNGNWMESASAQVAAFVNINEHWDGVLGVGAAQIHKMQGRPIDSKQLSMEIQSYIAQANFTYTMDDREAPKLQYTMGYFPYNYNPDVKNLGLYLLRGPVYPGCLISGFETKETMPIANILGARIHSNFGSYTQDVIISSEVDYRPYLDYSLAYIGQYQFGDNTFKLGAGFNLYHLIPISSKVTIPDLDFLEEPTPINPDNIHPYDGTYYYVDPETGDTIQPTNQGVKLTAFFSFDFRQMLGIDGMEKNDLKLYGEVAVIGLKNYKWIYEEISERIPVMVGFNFPAFGFMDHIALEVEWYGAKYRNDLEELTEDASPIPRSNAQADREITYGGDSLSFASINYPNEDPLYLNNMMKDNWKWSLHGAKTIGDHLRISGQIANDHFRPTGSGSTNSYFTAFSTLADWYWMVKLAYYF